jgi:two-component system, NtrC family, response regulator GlrR
MRVLLVDDYSGAMGSMAKLLRASGHHAFTAASGGEAIVIASCVDVQITMAQAKLPDMRGDQLAAFLREAYPAMLLVALSGCSPGSLPTAAANTFDYYWTMPVDREYVLGLLNNARSAQGPCKT